tara:strand:- start:191 stop:448 length:258 start_codon:yes stop_codon:yes gene_type:complete
MANNNNKDQTITIPLKEYNELTKRIMPLYHTERKPSGSWRHLITITRREYKELVSNKKVIDDGDIKEMATSLERIAKQLRDWSNG